MATSTSMPEAQPQGLTAEQLDELANVFVLLDELARRGGPLNARDLTAYAQRIQRLLRVLLMALTASRQESTQHAERAAINHSALQHYRDLAEHLQPLAASWMPVPFLRGLPFLSWLPAIVEAVQAFLRRRRNAQPVQPNGDATQR